MAAPNGHQSTTTDAVDAGGAPRQPVQAASTPPAPSPYDDLLCTICNLKACWMTPEAAGKAPTADDTTAEATGVASPG